MTIHRFQIRAACAAIALALFSISPLAQADALQDIGKLMKQGQHAQALEKADQHLASNTKDPQARFLKGLILTELNRIPEAIVVFTKLTEEFPESPEPYNNLAVIYAQQKQYDKARQSLEMAIRTHPSYATAHENLGDIYSHMASQSYDKALQIDSSNTSAQTKLAMIRDMMTGSRPTVGRSSGKSAATASAPETRGEAKNAAASVVASTTAAAPTQAPSKPDNARAIDAAQGPASGETGEITNAIESWSSAWSKKNVRAYLSHYAKDFETPRGESRSSWESERNKRIDKPGSIHVSFEKLRITMDGPDRATAKFRQNYSSSSFKTSGSKELSLVKRDGKWLIKREHAN